MLNLVVALRRLLTRQPSRMAIGYAWWYLLEGRSIWLNELNYFNRSERMRFIRARDRRTAKLLETWDTLTYRAWKAGEGQGGEPLPFQSKSPVTPAPRRDLIKELR